jgi:hypothetical protein
MAGIISAGRPWWAKSQSRLAAGVSVKLWRAWRWDPCELVAHRLRPRHDPAQRVLVLRGFAIWSRGGLQLAPGLAGFCTGLSLGAGAGGDFTSLGTTTPSRSRGRAGRPPSAGVDVEEDVELGDCGGGWLATVG